MLIGYLWGEIPCPIHPEFGHPRPMFRFAGTSAKRAAPSRQQHPTLLSAFSQNTGQGIPPQIKLIA